MKIITASQNTYLKLLLYGQPGSTKTRTAGTAAADDRTAPVLHLDIGGNTLSMADYKKKPTILLIDAMKELNAIYDWMAKGQPANHPMVTQVGLEPGYKTLVVDGISDVQRDSMAIVSGNTTVGPGDMPTAMQIQHYGQVLRQMTNMARLFYRLPMHVIFTALEKEERDEATGGMYYRPGLAGQSATEVAGYAYAVARMMHMAKLDARTLKELGPENTKDAVSLALFQPSGKVMAKDQHGFGVPYMISPTITKLLDALEARRVD